jgi:2-oxo-3-hexenedioate decarboxylase
MSEKQELLTGLAGISLEGEKSRRSIDPFYKIYPDLDVHDGYAGQKIRFRMMQDEGHRLVGFKLGGTSLAKLNQIETSLTAGAFVRGAEPKCGLLMDYMRLKEWETLEFDQLIHPKLEAELAFVLDKELSGPNVLAADVMMATAYVTPAFEIIDSRFHDFKMGGKADALIDNLSSARFKLGKVKKNPFKVDLIGMGVRTSFNGTYTGFSAAGAVLGHPARAVAQLAKIMHKEMDMALPAGAIILTGAICTSQKISRGDKIVSDYDTLGSIDLTVV